jgi:hypothetical protein
MEMIKFRIDYEDPAMKADWSADFDVTTPGSIFVENKTTGPEGKGKAFHKVTKRDEMHSMFIFIFDLPITRP